MINTAAAPGVRTRTVWQQIGARCDDSVTATHVVIAHRGLPCVGRGQLP